MGVIGKPAARSVAVLLGAVALLIAGINAGTARALSVAGESGISQSVAIASAVTPPTTPCDFASIATCASVDPNVKIYVIVSGDVSSCTFSWTINWDDGSSPETVVLTDPPTGTDLLAKHGYPVTAQKKYTITADATVSAGSCTATGGTLTFTLLAYVALGDSYSAGDGDGSYLPGTGYFGNECLRSSYAYPELVAKYLGNTEPNKQDSATPAFDFHACTGAEIPDFNRSQRTASNETVPAQMSFLRGRSDEVGLVSLTIGGNDAGFGPVMEYCATRTAKEPSCEAHSSKAVKAVLATIEKRLIALYDQIRKAPRVTKNAMVFVMGYPRFFPLKQAKTCPTGDPGHVFEPGDMAWINSLISLVDDKIAAAARAADVTYVDAYGAFSGHELCQSRPFLFHGSIPKITSFHPTAQGQSALASLVEEQVRKSA